MNSSAPIDLPLNLLFSSAVLILIFTILGLYGNACLVWVTVKFKIFHSPCGILIGMLAAGDFGHQFGHLLYVIILFTQANYISQRACFWIQFLPAAFMQHSVITMAVLGVDRLFCVLRPISYRNIAVSKRSQFHYLLILNIIPALHILAFVTASYFEMSKDPNKETICIIVYFFAGNTGQFWIMSATFFTTATVVIYIFIWIIVWKQAADLTFMKPLLKPLTIILALTFGGWFIGMSLVFYVSTRYDLSEGEQLGWMTFPGAFINLSVSANYFVYRFFGPDYKEAFKKLWGTKSTPVDSTT